MPGVFQFLGNPYSFLKGHFLLTKISHENNFEIRNRLCVLCELRLRIQKYKSLSISEMLFKDQVY